MPASVAPSVGQRPRHGPQDAPNSACCGDRGLRYAVSPGFCNPPSALFPVIPGTWQTSNSAHLIIRSETDTYRRFTAKADLVRGGRRLAHACNPDRLSAVLQHGRVRHRRRDRGCKHIRLGRGLVAGAVPPPCARGGGRARAGVHSPFLLVSREDVPWGMCRGLGHPRECNNARPARSFPVPGLQL